LCILDKPFFKAFNSEYSRQFEGRADDQINPVNISCHAKTFTIFEHPKLSLGSNQTCPLVELMSMFHKSNHFIQILPLCLSNTQSNFSTSFLIFTVQNLFFNILVNVTFKFIYQMGLLRSTIITSWTEIFGHHII
jgi:5-methylcytosine-specific restriction endonuclease McrBC regulatory subunit McrC